MIRSNKKLYISGVLFALVCLVAPNVNSEPVGAGLKDSGVEDEISGLVIDRTMTLVGRQYFIAFSNSWRIQFPNDSSTLVIHERPTAKNGSEIWVDFDGQQLGRMFLNPSRSNVEERAEQMVVPIGNAISSIKLNGVFAQSQDLVGRDF